MFAYSHRIRTVNLIGPERQAVPQRHYLLEIVEERCSNGFILITNQLSVSSWHDIIGEQTFGEAIVDRIVSNAHRLEFDGESPLYRAEKKFPLGQLKDDQTRRIKSITLLTINHQ